MAKIFNKPAKWLYLLLILVCTGLMNVDDASGEPLQILSKNKGISIEVEIADTLEKRRIGLMHRTELAPQSGMLFDFKKDQPVSMWMKNTLIELDMFFADRRGYIVYIKEKAQPGDLSIVSIDIPVRAVLEMKGGFAEEHEIREGDKLSHPIFDQ